MGPKRRKRPLAIAGPNFIRAWRDRRNLSQEEVAASAGIKQGHYSDIENGANTTLKTLFRIALALEVPAGWLLSRDPATALDAWALADQIASLPPGDRARAIEVLRALIRPIAKRL